jgi:hypothetical protein
MPNGDLLEPPPILVIFFNRPNCLEELLTAITEAGAKKIYFASDGPRDGIESDNQKISSCRDIAKLHSSHFDFIDFFYSQENLGCHTFVPRAISWFFSHEKQGVILEDDCIVDKNFLDFSSYALKKYQNSNQVMCISAANFQTSRVGNGDYFFSNYPYIWGWASWARAWQHYQSDTKLLNQNLEFGAKLDRIFKDKKQIKYWRKMLSRLASNNIDFWDAKWYLSIWNQAGISITPNKNLVRNVGFGEDATHTKDKRENPGMIIEDISYPIIPPGNQQINPDADRELFASRYSPTLFGYLRVAKSRLSKLLKFL